MMEETTPIHIENPKQLELEDEGEQMQDWELAQQIGKFLEVIDLELEHDTQHEYVDLMLRAPQVIPQSPPPPAVETSPREQGYVVLLDDDPIMNV